MTMGPRFVCSVWGIAVAGYLFAGLLTALAQPLMPYALMPVLAFATLITLPVLTKRHPRLTTALGIGFLVQFTAANGVTHLFAAANGWSPAARVLWPVGVLLPFALAAAVIVVMIRARLADRRAAAAALTT